MEKTGNRKWSFPKFNVLLWYSTKAVGSSWVTASREKHAFLAQDIGGGDPSSWERPWPLPPKRSYHAAMASTESSELKVTCLCIEGVELGHRRWQLKPSFNPEWEGHCGLPAPKCWEARGQDSELVFQGYLLCHSRLQWVLMWASHRKLARQRTCYRESSPELTVFPSFRCYCLLFKTIDKFLAHKWAKN